MLNKKKRIAELESEIARLSADLKSKNDEIDDLESRLRGDRVCSISCQRCIHAIKYPVYNAFGSTYTSYMCELDNKCKDYKTEDDNNGKP